MISQKSFSELKPGDMVKVHSRFKLDPCPVVRAIPTFMVDEEEIETGSFDFIAVEVETAPEQITAFCREDIVDVVTTQ